MPPTNELTDDFSRYGFYGTLTGAIAALVILLILAYILKDSKHAGVVLIGYLVAFVVCVVSFGYFSLRAIPSITADLLEGKVEFVADKKMKTLEERIEKVETSVKQIKTSLGDTNNKP